MNKNYFNGDLSLGLMFKPKNRKFMQMMDGLQNLVKTRNNGYFFLDASADCENKFSSRFTGPSNKLYGWLIAQDNIETFFETFRHGNLSEYANQKFHIWAYWDGEYSGDWLYSFDGPTFGEIDICEF